MVPTLGYRIKTFLLLSGTVLACLQPSPVLAAGYGRLAGVVSDGRGVPLMGATVVVIGPTAFATEAATQTVERMITDAHGRFTIAHLVPGCYSLKVSSPTRMPEMRNGIRVEAGETVVASFVLTDAFAPIRFQVPSNSVSSWGDDWKWVLRTSSNTRPILRYRSHPQTKQAGSTEKRAALPPSEHFAGFLPATTPRDPLAEDFGMASVFGYLHPLSPNSDLLVEGSLSPAAIGAGGVGTMLVRNQINGEPEQLGLVFHQFGLVPGIPSLPGVAPSGLAQARGIAATYSETRLLAPRVTITAGMDINYLSAIDTAFEAQPHLNLEYQATPQTMVSAQFGSARADDSNSMPDRIGFLNSFPRITQRDGRLEMERLDHAEVAANHRLGRSARVQAAAYHDSLRNAAIWGFGGSTSAQRFAGNALANPSGNGIVINGGSLQSTGFRAVYAQTFDSHFEVLGAYSYGSALAGRGLVLRGSQSYSQGVLTPERTNAVIAKFTADVPATHTRISTSYEWVPNDRLTMVDPAGQADFQVQPHLGMQVRQPIPTPSFLPLHIDAVADVQNLLSQGYTVVGQSDQKPMILSSGYHLIRGGFSVEF